MSDPESSSNDTNAPDPRLLEELDEHIREARAAAEETIGYEGGPSFVVSGEASGSDADATDEDDADVEDRTDTGSTEDDQTIAPPG